jgi:class 3 adenylate cyclase
MYNIDEAAEMAGAEIDLLRRLMNAAGIRKPGEMVSREDVGFLRTASRVVAAGYPEEALVQVLRVYSDALERVAEAETRTTHFYVHERFRAGGLSGQELMESVEAVGRRIEPVVEPAILYFHGKAAANALWEDVLTHLGEEIGGIVEDVEAPGQLRRAIMFVDLASFTPLADAMGDVKAAEVLERFSTLVRDIAARSHGRVVKQIGDAFMVIFPDPQSAVGCSLEIEARAEGEPHFPAARSGVHFGSVLYRDGDYVGSNVNIASRVAAEAERHQVVVTAPVRQAAKELEDVEFVRLGKRRLKGLAGELVLFEARPAGFESRETAVDPVCGMELGPEEVAARLSLEGQEQAFCSDGCLRKFVRAPEKYPG